MQTIRAFQKRLVAFLIIFITLPVLVSCYGKTVHEVPNRAPSPVQVSPEISPTEHLWKYLYAYEDELSGYATYSYVLAGRDENNFEAVSRYFTLVNAIQTSTANVDLLPADVSLESFNLFLIPAATSSGYSENEPNFELSRLLLTALSTSSPQSFSRPGPYIITLYQPISFGKKGDVVDILYVDLTDAHDTAIAEIVSAYKNEVLDEQLDGISKLESFRLSLLNLALLTQDSIGFAKSAYADLRGAFAE